MKLGSADRMGEFSEWRVWELRMERSPNSDEWQSRSFERGDVDVIAAVAASSAGRDPNCASPLGCRTDEGPERRGSRHWV